MFLCQTGWHRCYYCFLPIMSNLSKMLSSFSSTHATPSMSHMFSGSRRAARRSKNEISRSKNRFFWCIPHWPKGGRHWSIRVYVWVLGSSVLSDRIVLVGACHTTLSPHSSLGRWDGPLMWSMKTFEKHHSLSATVSSRLITAEPTTVCIDLFPTRTAQKKWDSVIFWPFSYIWSFWVSGFGQAKERRQYFFPKSLEQEYNCSVFVDISFFIGRWGNGVGVASLAW